MDIELQQAYEKFCNLVYASLLTNCPVDTGNMKYHIRMSQDGEVCKIIIDTVPYNKSLRNSDIEYEYASDTEYPWAKGRNPNEGWVRRGSILTSANNIVGAKNTHYLLGD